MTTEDTRHIARLREAQSERLEWVTAARAAGNDRLADTFQRQAEIIERMVTQYVALERPERYLTATTRRIHG